MKEKNQVVSHHGSAGQSQHDTTLAGESCTVMLSAWPNLIADVDRFHQVVGTLDGQRWIVPVTSLPAERKPMNCLKSVSRNSAPRFLRARQWLKLAMLLAIVSGPSGVPLRAVEKAAIIPRKQIFGGHQRIRFQIDDSARRLYFQSTENDAEIRYIEVSRPEQIRRIPIGRPLIDWRPLQDGCVVIASSDDGQEIGIVSGAAGYRSISGQVAVKSAKFLAASKGGLPRFAIAVTARDRADSGVYVADITQESCKRKYPQQPHANLFFDADLNLIAADGRIPGAGRSLFLFDATRQSWESFRDHSWSMDVAMLQGFSRIVSVTTDGQQVYFTSNRDSDKTELFRLNVSSRSVTRLAGDDRVDLLPFASSQDRFGHVTSVVGLYAKTIRTTIDDSWGQDFADLGARLDGDIGFLAAGNNDRQWIVREFTGGPQKIYHFDRDTKRLSMLMTDWPHLEACPLADRQAFEVSTRDGLTLPIHVYLPAGSDADDDGIPDQPLPTVLYVHGGPWAGVVHWNQHFHWQHFQLLANRGYAVINCEFRGSVGLGKAFVAKSRKAWHTGMLRDKVDIARWAVDQQIAAADKIAIWGWSYGGYAALAGLAFAPDTYACGISMYGITDMVAFGKTPFAKNAFWHGWVGDPFDQQDAAMLRQASPIHFVEQIDDPILLTTGSRDLRVPQSQVDRMAKVLADAGNDVTYFYYPDEGHDYRRRESWISFWAIAEKFLADHIGGRCEPNDGDRQLGNYVAVYGQSLIESVN